jgi:hypothetical protein
MVASALVSHGARLIKRERCSPLLQHGEVFPRSADSLSTPQRSCDVSPLHELTVVVNGESTATTGPPVQVALAGRPIRLSVGPRSACARLESGDWNCWGANRAGEIGPAKLSPIRAPRPLDLSELDLAGE